MRILLTCEDYFPHIGGAEVCVHNLLKELTRAGHSVTLFTNTTKTTDDEAGVVRVAWRMLPLQLWNNWKTLWKLAGEHDLVHCQYSFRLAAMAGVIARLRNKPMLLTQQGKGIVPEAGSTWYNSILIKVCQRVSMWSATHITSTSDEITDLTAAFVPRSKITLVSNGYDARRFKPDASLPMPPEFAALSRSVRKIVSVRRLVPKNGIHIFVQALGMVVKQVQDFHYFAIGEGRVEQFIRQLIEENKLQNHVTLLGKRGNDTLAAYYQHADLVVIPSSAEARSIACIEAMGMGRPLIASRVGGLIDLLGKDSAYGQLVNIYNDEACNYGPPDRLPAEQLQPLVDAIVAFLNDPKPLQAKGELARRLVEREYSWEAITKQYIVIYDTLLQHHRHSRA